MALSPFDKTTLNHMKTSQKFALYCWGMGICLLTQAAWVRAADTPNPAAGAQTNQLNAIQTANKRIEMEGSFGGIGAGADHPIRRGSFRFEECQSVFNI